MEGFKPRAHKPPNSFLNKIRFYGRMLVDLQILTIYTDLMKDMPDYRGKVLDLGCGDSPYRHLLSSTAEYYGVDTPSSAEFGYENRDSYPLIDNKIPFPDGFFDHFICTEVFEHSFNYDRLAAELYRVCSNHATGIITVPWSARFHYIPYDHFRYTPSALRKIFEKFAYCEVTPRGNEVAVIASKLVVLSARCLMQKDSLRLIRTLTAVIFSPFTIMFVVVAHFSLVLNLFSTDDPLGYTVRLEKSNLGKSTL